MSSSKPWVTDDDSDDERGILHVPWLGSFMAFSIDPTATLRYYCQGGDVEARELAQNLVCKQYAGYCHRYSAGLPDPEAEFTRMWLRPIQIGLTKPRPNRMDKFKHKTADMCIPILPTTEHPLGRPPLAISSPLPWANCYQPTMDDFDVLVEPQSYDYSNTPRFPFTAFPTISGYTSEDVRRINAIDAESAAKVADGTAVSDDNSNSESIESVGDYTPSLGDDIDAVESIFVSSVNAPMWSKIFTPAIKINSDLGVIKVLSDPAELWDEHAALKRIVDECKARRRATSRSPPSCQKPRHATLSSGFSNILAKFKRTRSKIIRIFRFKTVKSAM